MSMILKTHLPVGERQAQVADKSKQPHDERGFKAFYFLCDHLDLWGRWPSRRVVREVDEVPPCR